MHTASLGWYATCSLFGKRRVLLTHSCPGVQNAASHVLNWVSQIDHITLILGELHWLQDAYFAQLKALFVTYKTSMERDQDISRINLSTTFPHGH